MKAFIHQLTRNQSFPDPNVPEPPLLTDILVGELTLVPGAWIIYAKCQLTNGHPGFAPVNCRLSMESVPVVDDHYDDTLAQNQRVSITLCIGAHLTAQKNAQLFVRYSGVPFNVFNVTLSAIQVDIVQVAREHETALAPGSSPTAQVS